MKLTKITVEERLTYRHDIVIEQEVIDEKLERILEEIEWELRFGDDLNKLISLMEEHGLKIVKVIENDLSSPAYSEVEISEVEVLDTDNEEV